VRGSKFKIGGSLLELRNNRQGEFRVRRGAGAVRGRRERDPVIVAGRKEERGSDKCRVRGRFFSRGLSRQSIYGKANEHRFGAYGLDSAISRARACAVSAR
jgi:hypothetical protein